MTYPSDADIKAAVEHGLWLAFAGPLNSEQRHLLDIAKAYRALQRDKARIDLLEKKARLIGKIHYGPAINGERWVLDDKQNYFGPTLRAAIDAMEKEGT